MGYILIINEGVAPVEAFTTLGFSTSRGTDLIGQFGSGAKHAVLVALRHGLKVVICCGRDKIIFSTQTADVDDGIETRTIEKVYYSVNGRKAKETGWTLGFGEMDWTDQGMIIREFFSNAIDRTAKQFGAENLNSHFSEFKLGVFTLAEESEPRARDGKTSIYVESTPELVEYVANLGKHFLHVREDVHHTDTFIPKQEPGPARVYRRGVFIREIGKKPSLWDYNLADISLDESRLSNDYTTKAAIAGLYKKPTPKVAEAVIRANAHSLDVEECTLDSDYMTGFSSKLSSDVAEVWDNAWKTVIGDSVAVKDRFGQEAAERKGLAYVVVNDQMYKILAAAQSKTIEAVYDGKRMEEIVSPTSFVETVLDDLWEMLLSLDLTFNKDKPEVKCYKSCMRNNEVRLGYCQDDVIHINCDIAGSMTQMLQQTMLEELTHYITGASDNSRDFQDFAFRTAIALYRKTLRQQKALYDQA